MFLGDSDVEESDDSQSDSESDVANSSSDKSSEDSQKSAVAEVNDVNRELEDIPTSQEAPKDADAKSKERSSTEHCPDSIVTSAAKPRSKAVSYKEDFLICMVCLGDKNDPNDELIECDGCGIVVHEGWHFNFDRPFSDCYKVVDSIFMSSGSSSSSTDAWFCEACLAGVFDPVGVVYYVSTFQLCELCPSTNGAFKRTDNNRWVHLICALYTPGVAFNDPESLMDVSFSKKLPRY